MSVQDGQGSQEVSDALVQPPTVAVVDDQRGLKGESRALKNRDREVTTRLRRIYAYGGLATMVVTLAAANVMFAVYGQANDWRIPGSVMIAYFSSTVVEVIAVVAIITRGLFPKRLP